MAFLVGQVPLEAFEIHHFGVEFHENPAFIHQFGRSYPWKIHVFSRGHETMTWSPETTAVTWGYPILIKSPVPTQ